jgi:hypothetical protein
VQENLRFYRLGWRSAFTFETMMNWRIAPQIGIQVEEPLSGMVLGSCDW